MGRDELPELRAEDRFKIVVAGRSDSFSCARNQTLLQALTTAGIFLEANCGGRGVCGKCKIHVQSGMVAGQDGVTAVPEEPGIHLACQIYPREDLSIKLSKADTSMKGSTAEHFEADGRPLLKKTGFTPLYPTIERNHSLQEMVSYSLGATTSILQSGRVLDQLAKTMGLFSGRLTAVAVGDEIIALEHGDTSDWLFGVAFDIGTTTVVGMLVDVIGQRILATCTETNPQVAFGADVISRINAANDPGMLEAQSQAIRKCLNRIIEELCTSAKVSQDRIYAATIAGNSTMEHLLMQISPRSLVLRPYVPAFKQIAPFSPAEIGLEINPCGKVILLPNIASFIGADTTAAILATNQDISPHFTLMIDLGTNGEMVLGNRERLFACSTAAGPAFEGAHIRDGMRASAGAIEDVTIDSYLTIRTIGGGKAAGICGSGLVKAVAELRKKKMITASGSFDKALVASLPDDISRRLRQRDNQWEFVLVESGDSLSGREISITRDDIWQIQLAKSAICTGIEILMDKAGPQEGLPVFLAGAFGNYIDVQSALIIGLLPNFKQEQVKSVGNAAGAGAVQALLSKEKLDRCFDIAKKIHYVELAADPGFQNKFFANLPFP